MKLFVFGSSITSAYWNGAATYYRGIYKYLHRLGHEITFAEPDAYGRQQNRDPENYDYVRSIVYASPNELRSLLRQCREADLVIKHSGIGVDDELLEKAVLDCKSVNTQIAFWDVDSPATLARISSHPADRFGKLIPEYDFIFTYGGGEPVVRHYKGLGARNCYPIYNALDPDSHYPVAADPMLQCDLAFMGNRLPDRERRVEHFFLNAARLAPEFSFILGGEGWEGKSIPNNVRWVGHVATSNHNRMNCSARTVLNLNRDSMASVGFSPPTRIFEAAGAGACLITDDWKGIETFFQPEREILITKSAMQLVNLLRTIDPRQASQVGRAMRERALAEHTYAQRARQVNEILEASSEIGEESSQPFPVAGLETAISR